MSGFVRIAQGRFVVGHPLHQEHECSTLRTASCDPLRGAVAVWRPILKKRDWFNGLTQPVEQLLKEVV